MIPPIFPLCNASAAVAALLGANPLRLYPFGEAPQGVIKPYAVWQTITGVPENYLAGRPDADYYTIQLDVYGDTDTQVLAAARAIRDAVELKAYVTAWNGEGRDTETKNYRFTMSIDFIVDR